MTGDFSELGKLIDNLDKLAEVPSRASGEVARELTKELQIEFATGTDPYGKPWAPLKPSTLARGRHPPPLTASGALARGTEVTPMQHAGVQIVLGMPYGFFHQRGTVKMEARKPLPDKAMPRQWQQIINTAVSNAFHKRMGR